MKKIFLLFIFLTPGYSLLAQNWLWGEQGTTFSATSGVATDVKGNAYIAGTFLDSITFGNKHLVSPYNNSYLVKYDSMANVIWAAQTSVASGSCYAVPFFTSTDKFGDIYVTGYFIDTVQFGAFTLKSSAPGGDFFLSKYNSNGTVVWAKQANVPSQASFCNPFSLVTDNTGNIYVTGQFQDTAVFGADTLKSVETTSSGSEFLVKYDSNGNVLWAKEAVIPSAKSSGAGYSVALDKIGGVYVTGYLTDTLCFGTDTLKVNPPGSINSAVFLTKYDVNGNVLWARQANAASGACSSAALAVATDGANNAYITGDFVDTVSFGTDTLRQNPAISLGDLFLAKYNFNGTLLWAEQSRDVPNVSSAYTGTALSIDNSSNIYLSGTGYGTGNLVFGKDSFQCIGVVGAAWVMNVDSTGRLLCGTSDSVGGDNDNTIVTDPSGRYVYWGSGFRHSTIFGIDTLVNDKYTERPFIARWQPCNQILLGANDAGETESCKLFPDPNNGKFTIQLSGASSQKSVVEAYNILGEKIYSNQLSIIHCQLSINISGQPAGIYLYRVITETGNLVSEGKFIIQ